MLSELFTTFIYQPFFNVLVFFYWALERVTGGNADMGIAVIFLTILIRILLLPLSLAGDKSEAERREVAHKIKEIEEAYAYDPILMRKKRQELFRGRRGLVVGEIVNLIIQVMVSLMLWRIFATGLKGEDVHLLYSFMPDVEQPYNLVFLGRFDLTHASFVLNLAQSICIFVLETLSIYTSIYPPGKGEVVRLQLVLPVVSFLIFMFLPAGKKLFIITTLIISILITLYKFIRRKFADYAEKKEAEEAAAAASDGAEKIVVDVK